MKFFKRLRKQREQYAEVLRIRDQNVLYWLISPSRTRIKGPFLEVPRAPLGWIVVGYRADIFGTITHRESYETFEGNGSPTAEEKGWVS